MSSAYSYEVDWSEVVSLMIIGWSVSKIPRRHMDVLLAIRGDKPSVTLEQCENASSLRTKGSILSKQFNKPLEDYTLPNLTGDTPSESFRKRLQEWCDREVSASNGTAVEDDSEGWTPSMIGGVADISYANGCNYEQFQNLLAQASKEALKHLPSGQLGCAPYSPSASNFADYMADEESERWAYLCAENGQPALSTVSDT